MTSEDILQALKLTAMGRYGHDLQREFADKLADLFARDKQPAVEMPVKVEIAAEGEGEQPVKRGPGRPKKAE